MGWEAACRSHRIYVKSVLTFKVKQLIFSGVFSKLAGMKLRLILMVLSLLAFLSASTGGFLYYSSLKKSAI